METNYRISYELEGYTTAQITRGLTDILKPCPPSILTHFVTLESFKPFYEPDIKNPDQDRKDMIYEMLYRDIKDYPEVAVILAVNDLRKSTDRYFPLEKILPEVREYTDFIYSVLDYFKKGDK